MSKILAINFHFKIEKKNHGAISQGLVDSPVNFIRIDVVYTAFYPQKVF